MSAKNLESTQRYLPISEIKNDCIVLKNGELRAVLLCSSLNFGLKSEAEQNAIIQGYINFLNSLDFPLQIVVQSRPFNIGPYLEKLEKMRRQQRNELLRAQMADYIDFVKELVELGEIMSRRFYLVVPYNPGGEKKRGFFSQLAETLSTPARIILKEEKFKKYREILFQRVDKIISGLNSIGLRAVPLDTQSLIELCYNIYNPKISANQKLAKIEDIRMEM
ncbi:TraC family protein [bacterium]|nr:TraC family protein [bacterium]